MNFAHFFVNRPIFAAVLSIVLADRRRHRLHAASGRAISRDRAADHRGARLLSGRRRRDGRRDRGDADRTGDQRRRAHALHVVLFLRRRLDVAHHHLPPGHRSRRGAGAGPEPRLDRRTAPAGRGAPARHHHGQELARPDDGHPHAVARRHIRPALRLELCALAGARRPAETGRRRRRADLRRARIFAARLARPGKAVRLRHDRRRRGPGAARPERAGVGRLDRRAADRRRLGLPVHGHHARALRRRARLPLRHRQVDRGRPPDLPAGRGAHRTRRQGLRHQFLSQQQGGGGARHLPAAGHQRSGLGGRNPEYHRGAFEGFPGGAGLRDHLQSDRVHRRIDQRGLCHHRRGDPAGGDRHHRLPAVVAHGDRADRGDTGLADRHAGRAARLRLLAQHAHSVRAGAGGRHRRRRRHRGGGEYRAQHQAGARSARRCAQDHG